MPASYERPSWVSSGEASASGMSRNKTYAAQPPDPFPRPWRSTGFGRWWLIRMCHTSGAAEPTIGVEKARWPAVEKDQARGDAATPL